MPISLRGRYWILAASAVLLVALVWIAGVRIARVVREVEARSNGFGRIKTALVKQLGVPERQVTPRTTIENLERAGVRREDLIRALDKEFRKDLSDDDLPAGSTLAELGDQLEG